MTDNGNNLSSEPLDSLPLEELLREQEIKETSKQGSDSYVTRAGSGSSGKDSEQNKSLNSDVSKNNLGDDLSEANYSSVNYNHDDYIGEKFAEARHKYRDGSEDDASVESDPVSETHEADDFDNETINDDYPPASFLRSTPPRRSSSQRLDSEPKSSYSYEPYYESINKPKTEDDEETSLADEPINSSTNEEAAGQARADKASSKAFSKAPIATRTSRAAMTAGLDLADHFHNSKLKQSVSRVRAKHPYLMDRPLTITDEDAYSVLDKVRSVPTYRITQVANELNSEEVKFIFHVLLVLDENDSQTFRAIQQIAVIRASWSLYTVGWSTLQRNFPNRRIQQTLELVYSTLVNDSSRANIRPSYSHRAIGDIINLAKSDDGFVSDVTRNLNQSYNLSPDEGLETFISEYQVLVESSFGGSVFGEFFRRADLTVLYKKKEILCQALPYMHPAISSEVVSRIVASKNPIEGDKLYVYKQIADIFLHKSVNHPIWQYMSRDLNRSYKTWYIEDRINIQTQSYPAKRDFLETYIDYIDDVAMISQDIMAIRFSKFILIDDRRRGDSLIHYDYDILKDLLTRGHEEKDLANPRLAEMNSVQAMSYGKSDGVILLNILPPALEHSRRFLDKLLGKSNRNRLNLFNNWFKD